MLQTRIHRSVVVLIALAVIFSVTACEQLNIKNLRANYHFSKANAAFREREYRDAIAEYEAALESNPSLVQAYRFLGESYKSLYKPGSEEPQHIALKDKALEALNKAYEIEPDNREIIYSLGDMYDKLQDFDSAEKLYLRILELEPHNMNNYYVVAEFYKRYAGNPETAKKAEEMYLRRIEIDPENPQGYAYAANYYETLPASAENIAETVGNFDKANHFWEMRIGLQPDSAEAWLAKAVNRWGRSYRFQNLSREERMKTARESEEALLKAVELDPEYPEPYSWLSVLYRSTMAKLEPEREARYEAEGQKYIDRFQDLRKRAAERKKLEDELKKG